MAGITILFSGIAESDNEFHKYKDIQVFNFVK